MGVVYYEFFLYLVLFFYFILIKSCHCSKEREKETGKSAWFNGQGGPTSRSNISTYNPSIFFITIILNIVHEFNGNTLIIASVSVYLLSKEKYSFLKHVFNYLRKQKRTQC